MESPLVGGQPVVYVDGVRIDGSRDEALKLVNPDQIDHIEVIKGSAARRQFGSEARNGVIQIYLKPGETPSKKEGDAGR